MAGKSYCIRLSEIEQQQLKECNKEGIGLMDVVRAGLSQYLNKSVKPEIIKTKEQAEVKVVKLTEDGQFNTYGCGCVKVSGKVFCPIHKRM